MKPRTGLGLAGFLGRRAGSVLADRLGVQAAETLHTVLGLSAPVMRAFVDAFLAERLVAVTWPSLAVLGAVLLLHGVALAGMGADFDRLMVGLVVLAALVWSALGVLLALRAARPFVAAWFVTALPPIRHARLMIFTWVRGHYAAWSEAGIGGGFPSAAFAAALGRFQDENRLSPDEFAFHIADHLAPLLLRHLLARALLLVAPVLGAIVYYRLVIYPWVIAGETAIGPWAIAAYPLAALIDLCAGTGLRAWLEGR